MASEKFKYRSQTYTIHLFEKPENRWAWAYSIGQGGYYEGPDRPVNSKEVVLAEAKQEAERRIDQLLDS
jgi:hypothetical protein